MPNKRKGGTASSLFRYHSAMDCNPFSLTRFSSSGASDSPFPIGNQILADIQIPCQYRLADPFPFTQATDFLSAHGLGGDDTQLVKMAHGLLVDDAQLVQPFYIHMSFFCDFTIILFRHAPLFLPPGGDKNHQVHV